MNRSVTRECTRLVTNERLPTVIGADSFYRSAFHFRVLLCDTAVDGAIETPGHVGKISVVVSHENFIRVHSGPELFADYRHRIVSSR